MLKRWWIYQQERFPLFSNGILILVFSTSAVSYSALLREQFPTFESLTVAAVSTFLFFLLLRITDEFKDFDDDRIYRPYRPVPRGLVSLKELGLLGVFSLFAQLGLALYMSRSLAILLSVVWFYFVLMSQDFFLYKRLKAHPVAYLLTHNVIVPLIALYATACDWLLMNSAIPPAVIWFLMTTATNGLILEIGRKIRGPNDEEVGVDSYSALWGRDNAVLVWVTVICCSAVATFWTAKQIDFVRPMNLILLVLGVGASVVAYSFFNHPTRKSAKWINLMSGLWVLFTYLGLGVIPLLLRYEIHLPFTG
ncbi:UbiA family prenyltransferase [Spirulina subsalsa]|uniref:UbiA family prenyltransferase n=1 Tax=Spirulina subsalsa TaxID=54311 RepID=UPI0002FD1171|nr:UbiA family prenyltransferase [Spirulina subsalsa]